MARLVQFGEFVGPGERLTAAYLETHLPDDWVVICNKELVAPDGTTRETDFVIVARNVVFVVEEKHWAGRIDGDARRWYPSFGAVRSPISIVESNVRRLAGVIKDAVPDAREVGGLFVFGRVILSHPSVDIQVEEPRVANHVLLLEGCEAALERFDAGQPSGLSISGFRKGTIGAIELLRDRPDVPAQIGDYEVVESLGRTGSVRTVFARHADGSERLLKIIERPVTAVTEVAVQAQEAALRDYNALQVLSAARRTPRVDPYFSWDDNQFWVVPVHPLAGRTLAEDRLSGSPEKARARAVVHDAFAGLAQVHAAGILHRDLRPETIYLSPDERVGFSDFTLSRISGRQSLAGFVEPEPTGFRAPEAQEDLFSAIPASDVFSLAASLSYWLSGEEPRPGTPAPRAIQRASDIVGADVASILDRCLASDPLARPDASAVARDIELLARRQVPASNRGDYSIDELIDGQYRIVRELGRGATAITYLALDEISQQHFVLKRITNPEWVGRLARNEFVVLLDLNHPNLPRVYDVRPPNAAFHLKLEYVRGSSLQELSPARRGDVLFAMRVANEMLAALAYLATRHLIHRDLSPSNILVPDEDSGAIKLIDFGVATTGLESETAVGTPRYRAPEIERGGAWTETADVYSLAVILIEVLLGRLPYSVENGIANKAFILPPARDESDAIGRRLLGVLFTAAHPDRGSRYRTAVDFRAALQGALHAPPDVAGSRGVNPYVDQIRSAYRNCAIGNADNRGIDSAFTDETYVPTALDRKLLPRVLAGDFDLVILTGNPGDGKTAFLQKLGRDLEERDGEVLAKDAAGWRLRFGGRIFAALFDASESNLGRSSDELVRAVIQPAIEANASSQAYTGLLAVNDGRLQQFLESSPDLESQPVGGAIRAHLEGHPATQTRVVVVDLKVRSLASARDGSKGLFDDILHEFIRMDRWDPCSGCSARLECPILFNAMSFADPALGGVVASGLGQLLLDTHLRRERRPTLRDLRSALSYLITHDMGCDDVHADRDQGLSPAHAGANHYYNAAFDGSGAPDLLLDDWQVLDPSDSGEPRLDRYLFLSRSDSAEVDRLFVGGSLRANIPASLGPLDNAEAWIRSSKRRFAFEGDTRIAEELNLARPADVSPYRHRREFVCAVSGTTDPVELRSTLLAGLTRAGAVPPRLVTDGLGLRLGDPDAQIVVIKVLAEGEFAVAVDEPSALFVETTADSLRLVHRSGIALRIGLDLFEFLRRCSDGLVVGSEEHLALAEDVERFKNRLLAHPGREVRLSDDGVGFLRVVADDGLIRLEPE